jgi:myo-inositol-1(or 4)-monophosphatase
MDDTVEFVEELARRAGAILMGGFGHVTQIEHKGATDLVTEYDRRSEAMIVAALKARFPDHAILAEEGGPSGASGSSGYCWVVDPLDGTTNFAHGLPTFAVSIVLTLNNRPVIGVVHDPSRGELFAAEAGRGATLNGASIRVSAETSLRKALLATGFPYDSRNAGRDNFKQFVDFQMLSQGVRRAGSAALDAAWVGAGRLDGYWEFGIHPWDIGAGALIVQEAGGRASTATGDTDFMGSPSIVVSNGQLHDQMLAVLRAPL